MEQLDLKIIVDLLRADSGTNGANEAGWQTFDVPGELDQQGGV